MREAQHGQVMKISTVPIIRLAHPLAFGAFLEHIGAPSKRHFRRHGLPVQCNDGSNFVPLRQAWALFDAAAQHEDPLIGWHVGRFVGDRRLNHALLEILETAPTLYEALKRLVRMVSSEASHLQIGVQERRDDILLYTHYSDLKGVRGYSTSQAYQIEVYVDLVRHFLGRRWMPAEIGIESTTTPSVAEEHFPLSRILTNQRAGYLAVPRACLHRSAPGRTANTQAGSSLTLTQSFNFVETLRTMLRAYLQDGYVSARKAASLFGVSERTLARRLAGHGLTYKSVIDELRFDLAKELLTEPDLRTFDVSRLVGFDDPSHFTRMFRRVGGLTPRQFREALRA